MNPVLILQVLAGIQAIIQAAPQIESIVTKGKELFTAMFTGNLISEAQQNALHAHIDSIAAMAKSGLIPPAWTVEPDPTE